VAVLLMGYIALPRLQADVWALAWGPQGRDAVDLKYRYLEVQRWFEGLSVYSELRHAVYPPATYVILWPLVGWLPLPAVRLVWALLSVAALGWLCVTLARAIGVASWQERVFTASLPIAMAATSYALHQGQFVVLLLPVMVVAVLTFWTGWNARALVLLSPGLLLVTLIKPSLSVPFFWLALLAPVRWRRTVPLLILVALAYAALTLLATSFQEKSPQALLGDLLRNAEKLSEHQGRNNLHTWLTAWRFSDDWYLPASLATLLVHGAWVWFHRRTDFWIVAGVTAIVARIWTYHYSYDDLLIVLPMVALLRIARDTREDSPVRWGAGLLLGILTTVMVVSAPPGVPAIYNRVGVPLLWGIVLLFLLACARRPRTCSSGTQSQEEWSPYSSHSSRI